ncbi:MAG: COQ9 family protein [Hyphomonadaceae bacterium]|nr:COQ9 family protein [Hyphomonadaceae bacterium]
MTTPEDAPDSTPSAELRQAWLKALLPLVPSQGWSEMAARQAAIESGLSAGEQALAAPGGVMELMDAFFDAAETHARTTLAETALDEMRVHERVAFGVRAWLDVLAPHRHAVERASGRAFWPTRTGDAAQRCWSVADMVWDAIGDTSQDYNFYSKRALLAAVIPAIVLYWQGNPEDEALDAFIARRLKSAMMIGRSGGRFLKPFLDAFGSRAAPKEA